MYIYIEKLYVCLDYIIKFFMMVWVFGNFCSFMTYYAMAEMEFNQSKIFKNEKAPIISW